MKTYLMIALLFVVSCASSKEEGKVAGSSNPTFIPTTGSGNKLKLAKVKIGVAPRTNTSLVSDSNFFLANATTFKILLTGCKTGWTTTATEANTTLNVYIDDRDCLGKLTEFTYGGKTFKPKAGSDFPTWATGDTATFEDQSDNTNLMGVNLVSTLDNPVSGTEAITYVFYNIKNGGSTTILSTDVGDPHTLTVMGQSAPAFTVYSVAYQGTNATGGGKFVIKLHCAVNVTATACSDNDFSVMTYKLVEDTFGSAPTLTDARTLFSTVGTSITLPGDYFAVGAGGMARGGIKTIELEGPNEMHNHPNMMLVVRADGQADANTANDSFTYFNIDVQILSY